MEAKLIKKDESYFLQIQPYTLSYLQFDKPNGHILQLSLKNCQAIERGYDLDELADENVSDIHEANTDFMFKDIYREYFKEGFQKALELMGDKKFSEDDVRKAITGFYMDDKILIESNINKQIQSLQQTEWDVEIQVDNILSFEADQVNAKVNPNFGNPILDADGCLILKLKSE